MNIREFSKKIGMSPATVSRILNGHKNVNDNTRALVLLKMKEYGFTPNLHAQRLSTGKTNVLGMDGIHQDILSSPFLLELSRCIRNELREHGYSLMLNMDNNLQGNLALKEWLKTRVCDGYILPGAPIFESLLFDELAELHIPVVSINQAPFDLPPNMINVVISLRTSALESAHHLYDLGHRKIALVIRPSIYEDHFVTAFKSEMEWLGYPVEDKQTFVVPDAPEPSAQAFRDIMLRENPPTALVVREFLTALAFINESRKLNINVPRDVSILTVGNFGSVSGLYPQFTSADVRCDQLAKASIEAFFTLLGDIKTVKQPTIIDSRLNIQQTTAPPSG